MKSPRWKVLPESSEVLHITHWGIYSPGPRYVHIKTNTCTWSHLQTAGQTGTEQQSSSRVFSHSVCKLCCLCCQFHFVSPAVCLPVHHQLISLCILVAFSVIGLLHPAIRSFLSCDHICHLNSNSHRFSLICLLFVPVHYIMQVEIFLASLVSRGWNFWFVESSHPQNDRWDCVITSSGAPLPGKKFPSS